MIHTRKKKMFCGKFFSKNVLRKRKKECFQQLEIHQSTGQPYQVKAILQTKILIPEILVIYQGHSWQVSLLQEQIIMVKLMKWQDNKH